MSTPLDFARRLAPLLAGRCWAIGGSVLLQRLGLLATPRDLDLLTTAADFPAVYRELAAGASDVTPAPHPEFATRHFARFRTADGLEIDLMADLAIRLETHSYHWPFDASAIEEHDGLPWCAPEDWALLYRLLGRTERSQALDGWLAAHGVHAPQRLAANLFAGYPDSALKPPPPWWPWEE